MYKQKQGVIHIVYSQLFRGASPQCCILCVYNIFAPKYTTIIARGYMPKVVCVVISGTPFPEYSITLLVVVPKQKQRIVTYV